ncbi:MAG: type IV pilin protein [Kiritimatiellia bacterium]|jgi:prepilin-type N-terminal cleavage/methylation domain-containing protein|nr:prepilin-type N-terminal cleavage/methylation domain-containing protein [Kiritimatiellia bacterium]
MKKNRKGFTLVEIMTVVAVIGILAVIAIPNYLLSRKKSRQNACIVNLKQIQNAKDQSLMANGGVTSGDLFGNERYIKVEPKCPAGGVYTVGDADANPSCDYTAAAGYEHALPSN